jgi:hypothetical protein
MDESKREPPIDKGTEGGQKPFDATEILIHIRISVTVSNSDLAVR